MSVALPGVGLSQMRSGVGRPGCEQVRDGLDLDRRGEQFVHVALTVWRVGLIVREKSRSLAG